MCCGYNNITTAIRPVDIGVPGNGCQRQSMAISGLFDYEGMKKKFEVFAS